MSRAAHLPSGSGSDPRSRARARRPARARTTPSAPGFSSSNIDDYVSPLLEHVVLVLGSVVAGFVLAMILAVLSHGRRWLIPAFVGATGVLYTIPSIALFLLLLPITGPRHRDGADRALPLHAADHLPQRERRARERPGLGQGRRPRDGDDQAADCSGRSSFPSPSRRSSPASGSRPSRRSRSRRWRSSPAPAGSAR